MQEFMQNHTLALTPLSPIHIGCGVDLEPTQFVIDGGVLYAFDPAQVKLKAPQKNELLRVAKSAKLGDLHKFFNSNLKTFKSFANEFIAVAPKLVEEYNKKIGKAVQHENDFGVFNKLYLERTTFNPISKEVYIPGSSVKGALRTGVVDKKRGNNRPQRGEKRSADFEKEFIGDFDEGITRFFKLSDFIPTNDAAIDRQVNYAVNRKKRVVLKDGIEVQAAGLSSRKETICPAQYRAFTAQLTLTQASGQYTQWQTNLNEWVSACNKFHLPLWHSEMAILDEHGRAFGKKSWCDQSKALIEQLKDQMMAGQIMLIRLGIHGGAESKVLTDGIAQIKINQGKGRTGTTESQTKTIWLSAQDDRTQKDMLPFGWAIIEVNPQGTNEYLEQWCKQNSAGNPNSESIKQKIKSDKQDQAKEYEEEQKAIAKQLEVEKLQEESDQEAKRIREDSLKGKSENMLKVQQLIYKIEDQAKKINSPRNKAKQNTGLDAEAKQLVNQAIKDGNWSAEEKEQITKLILEELPKVVENMGEKKDNRKRFKLNELNG